MNRTDRTSRKSRTHWIGQSERLDFFQNITIALLSVSAVLLFSHTEMFRLAWETAEESFLLAVHIPSRASVEAELSAPVRLAASGPLGRQGDLFLTTDSPAFQPVRPLLAAALGRPNRQDDRRQDQWERQDRTPQEWEEATRGDFFHALDGTSLYFDFLHPLPLSLLAGFADAVSTEEREARCVCLAVEDSGAENDAAEDSGTAEGSLEGSAEDGGTEQGGTVLYLWDGKETYSRRPAPIDPRELEEAMGQYQPASFARDHDEPEDVLWRSLAPLSLLPGKTPSLPQLSAASGSAGTDALLTALRFNPLTNSRYPESNGTEVVVEGSRTVRIRSNGSIYYQAGGAEERTVLSVESAGEVPTPWEAAVGCASILQSLMGSGGTLYPSEVRQEENRTFLRFDYQFSGVPIRFSDGRSAAEVALEGRAVSSLELRPRRYAAAEWESLLLPLPQALGVAALRPGSELSVGYADDGSGQIAAAWMEG